MKEITKSVSRIAKKKHENDEMVFYLKYYCINNFLKV